MNEKAEKIRTAGVLLACVLAILACGLISRFQEDPPLPPPPRTAESSSAAFTVTALTASRSGDHLRLTITVQVKNNGREALTLAPPAAQLWINKDNSPPPPGSTGTTPPVPHDENQTRTAEWLAWISNDRAVPPFIAPGLEPAVVAPGAENPATLEWWLPLKELAYGMDLEIAGARAPVKSQVYYDPSLIPEENAVRLLFPDWKTAPDDPQEPLKK